MTVFHLMSSAGFYGAESMVVTLLKELRRAGCRVILGVFHNSLKPNLQLAHRASNEGIDVEVIHCKGRFDFSVLGRLADIVSRFGVDVFHTHGYKANIYGLASARSGRLPILATCHNWTNDSLPVRLYGPLDRVLLKQFRAVAAVSPKVAQRLHLAGVSQERIRVIPNGIDLETFEVDVNAHEGLRSRRGSVIGMVGRLVSQKGFLDVLFCGPDILSRFPDASFCIVGDGPQRGELEKAASRLGIRKAVMFAGVCDDMRRMYSEMDIFVLPSLNEGMPMTILEAMAVGKPIVATAVGAIPDLVRHEETGLLVEPGDRKSLFAALIRMLENPIHARHMGLQAKALVERAYSSTAMSHSYIALYRSVIQEYRAS